MFKSLWYQGQVATLTASFNNWVAPFIGVQYTAIVMAFLGALLGTAVGDKAANRIERYKKLLGQTFFAVVLVAVVPSWLGWEWYTPALEGPFAGLVALILQPDMLRRWIKKKGDDTNAAG